MDDTVGRSKSSTSLQPEQPQPAQTSGGDGVLQRWHKNFVTHSTNSNALEVETNVPGYAIGTKDTDINRNPSPTTESPTPPHTRVTRRDNGDALLPYEGLPSIRLTFFQKIAIASGHFQNDLCAALWFSYLLLYFEKVVGFNMGATANNYPGTLMLIGQVVDGISTPMVGYEVDHTNIWPYSYGRCKSWHLWGSVMVVLSFPFIFSPVIGGSSNTVAWVKFFYYLPFIVIFQIGWASVQISHLAIIPKMHPDELVRTELFSIRYAFTVVANISIFLMTWLKLRLQEQADETAHAKCEVDGDDTGTFSIISVAAVVLGLLSTLLFHLGVREENDSTVKRNVAAITSRTELIRRISQMSDYDHDLITSIQPSVSARPIVGRSVSIGSQHSRRPIVGRSVSIGSQHSRSHSQRVLIDEESVEERVLVVQTALAEIEHETQVAVTSKQSIFSTKALSIGKDRMGVIDWLSLPQMYIVALIYMSTRLSINLGQVYIPFYLQDSLRIECTSVALIPFTMYLSGFCVSFVVKFLNKHFGRQLSYGFGASLECVGCILILTLDWDGSHETILKSYIIYVVAILLGGGASAILVTSLSITADLIGNNIESGAFVYGSMSFCDKVSCGLAIVLVDSLVPCSSPPGPHSTCAHDANIQYYKDVLAYSIGGCVLVGVLGIVLLTFYILRKNMMEIRHKSLLSQAIN